ncbi:MAG: hypothetical protein AAGJ85_03555, partial [Pseudomonadota bacterium]
VEILTEFGIEIARRTVAKYRESLGIPSSVQRRRLQRKHPAGAQSRSPLLGLCARAGRAT